MRQIGSSACQAPASTARASCASSLALLTRLADEKAGIVGCQRWFDFGGGRPVSLPLPDQGISASRLLWGLEPTCGKQPEKAATSIAGQAFKTLIRPDTLVSFRGKHEASGIHSWSRRCGSAADCHARAATATNAPHR